MNQINCPYCNLIIPHASAKEPWFNTPCCNKAVLCTINSVPDYSVHVANDRMMQKFGVTEYDNKEPSRPGRKTVPRWAHVYTDGYKHFVRIIPPCDLREHGRGHGVALGNTYTSKQEAEVFADSMERYFGDAEHDIKTSAQIDIQ